MWLIDEGAHEVIAWAVPVAFTQSIPLPEGMQEAFWGSQGSLVIVAKRRLWVGGGRLQGYSGSGSQALRASSSPGHVCLLEVRRLSGCILHL